MTYHDLKEAQNAWVKSITKDEDGFLDRFDGCWKTWDRRNNLTDTDVVRKATSKEIDQMVAFDVLMDKYEEEERKKAKMDAYNNAVMHGLKVEKPDEW